MFKSWPLVSRFFVFLFLPLLLLVLWEINHFRATLPQIEGVVLLEGLNKNVEIRRDEAGVPHISAKTDQDAFFSMGYLHAQDRMWQLEIQRRIGSGRLSEIFGEGSLKTDQMMRTLRFYRSSKQDWESLEQASKDSLLSYTKGINAWIKGDHPLPIEFRVLNVKPDQWTVYDSLAWIKVLSWSLSTNHSMEIIRTLLNHEVGPQKAAELVPGYPKTGPKTVSQQFDILQESWKELAILQAQFQKMSHLGGKFAGSNAWVVAGKHTESGMPILAGDPHLASQIPSIWYLAEIKGDRIHAVGSTFVGLPFIIFGRNESIAWGGTNMIADTQDLFVERINPDNPDQYEVNGVMMDMEVIEEEIHIKQPFPDLLSEPIAPVIWKVRRTRNGPVLSDVIPTFNQAVSLRWTSLEKADRSYEAFLQLNYAKNWEEFQQALRKYIAPALNYIYADRQGNIGYQGAGKIPIRATGDGTHPAPAWTDEYQWTSWIPFEEMPQSLNPKSGFLINANNKVIDDDYPYAISQDWSPPHRAQRIQDLLEKKIRAGGKFTALDMIEIQGDETSLIAQELLPFLLKVKPQSEEQEKAISYLKNWDRIASKESVATTIFQSWMKNLKQSLLSAPLKGSWAELRKTLILQDFIPEIQPSFLLSVLNNPDSQWCNQLETEKSKGCDEVLLASLEQSLKELRKLLGRDMEDWTWGDAHTLRFSHTPFSKFKVLELIFERKTRSGGLEDTINVSPSIFSVANGYEQDWSPSYRQIIDWGREKESLFNIPTGQSGNFFSSHYDDQISSFQNLEFLSMDLSQAEKKGGSHLLLLQAK